MSIRNVRIRLHRGSKKDGISAFSSSRRETEHYLLRCMERNEGTVAPFCRKKIKKMIKSGEIIKEIRRDGKVRLTVVETGEKFGVNKNITKVHTFIR